MLFLLSALWLTPALAAEVGDFYPNPKPLDPAVLSPSPTVLAEGCVHGDCNADRGVYLVVEGTDAGSTEGARLTYHFLVGTFRDQQSFLGPIHRAEIPLIQHLSGTLRTSTKVRFREREIPDLPLVRDGGMIRSDRPSSRRLGAFVPHGVGTIEPCPETLFRRCNGWFHHGVLRAATYDLGPQSIYPMHPYSHFVGLVSRAGLPLLGTWEPVRSGSNVPDRITGFHLGKEQAGPWRLQALPPPGAPPMPSTEARGGLMQGGVLQRADLYYLPHSKAIQEAMGHPPGDRALTVQAPGETGDVVEHQLTGSYFGPSGEPEPADFTGEGFFLAQGGDLYVGAFAQGAPHGLGALYVAQQQDLGEGRSLLHEALWTGRFDEGALVEGTWSGGEVRIDPGRAVPVMVGPRIEHREIWAPLPGASTERRSASERYTALAPLSEQIERFPERSHPFFNRVEADLTQRGLATPNPARRVAFSTGHATTITREKSGPVSFTSAMYVDAPPQGPLTLHFTDASTGEPIDYELRCAEPRADEPRWVYFECERGRLPDVAAGTRLRITLGDDKADFRRALPPQNHTLWLVDFPEGI
ncbi:MAG: hypothetical protein EA397_14940 [Deltaproteobacteria bacterium]|nr:MAG: hypothetical protein EA397_14940 [Deltaproteobacteria bacterium]